MQIADGHETKMADLPEGWRLVAAMRQTVVASSPTAKLARIFRLKGEAIAEVTSSPIPAIGIALSPDGARALIQNADRLGLIDSADERTLWSSPIPDMRHVAFAESERIIAVSGIAVYALESGGGRILKSYPLALAADAPLALDRSGRRLAYLDSRGGVAVMDLETGTVDPIKDVSSAPTRLAWSSDTQLLIGASDGSVVAWQAGAGQKWIIPSPFSRGFQASAWPGQPLQGVVLDLAVSQDKTRVAVLRQDTQTVDLHDLFDGRLLTKLTPPWSTLSIPAQIAFGPNDELVTAWAFHAMTRDKPRYVAVHRLPRDFDAALAAASARLAAMKTIWSPAGPP